MVLRLGRVFELTAVWYGGDHVHTDSKSKDKKFLVRALRLLGPAAVNVSAHEWIMPIILAFMARTTEPELAIAGYSLGLSVAFFVSLPRLRIQALTVVFTEDRESRQSVSMFSLLCAATVGILIALLAFTPVGSFFLNQLFSPSDELKNQASLTLKILVVWGIFSVIRGHLYGIALRREKSILLWIGALVGLVSVTIVSLTLYLVKPELNAQIGAWAVSIGVLAESGVAIIGLWITRSRDEEATGTVLKQRTLLAFFVPLLFAALLPSVTLPLVNFAMSRSADPEIAIAAFTVAFGIFSILSIPANGIQPTVLTLFGLKEPAKQIQIFSIAVGMFTLIPLLVLALSQTLSSWIFKDIMGLGSEVFQSARIAIWILVLLPPWLAIEQLYAAALMANKQPRGIVYINIGRLFLLIILVSLSMYLPSINGVIVGTLIVSLTLFAEAIFAIFFGKSAFSSLANRM